ncbi:DUF1893 domain-containing protein [Peptostreptococcaceae bacterium OttesenSCG-928-C18]|nr:DUF1893 domain-containing protein [Peptostreptococcaceae bacterium OttesenSCG-928-C18]
MEEIKTLQRKILEKKYKLVVIKNKETIFTSNKNGIVPMYDFYNSKTSGDIFIADKFIGGGAAKLLLEMNVHIEELYAQIISESALVLLKEKDVKISYDKKVEKILNRTGDDLCPVEKISQNNDKFEDFYKELSAFLKKTKQI